MIRIFGSIVFLLSFISFVDNLAVMSVDLGTEFVKIAIVKPGVPMEIALNKESRRKTPVIVAIKGKDREFGEAAVSRSMKIPGQSYMFLRELVGKQLDNPVIQQFIKRFPFYKLKANDQTGELLFEHDSQTNFTVEELLAMILQKAREYASDFAEQTVDSAVITVPAYFSQSERRAVRRACELANIKLLQLMNDNTAVALNYGIFRRKDFNTTGSNYLFYDMGSQSTICTLASFSLVKTKDAGFVEEVPQLTIKSVSFDRDLGGLEFQIRLRDYFIEKFHEQHPKIDLRQNAKALTKIFREAERAKHVLSANNEYTAQVEGLIDEIDFKHRITREIFESLCVDLFQRVRNPIDELLKNSEITLDEIQQVLLFGGSTRIPKVQEELAKSLPGIDLGKSLNTDEAAAMGAVYQAAALSKGYRVKKFLVKDANQFPINVQFERRAAEQIEQKTLDLPLFTRKNFFPNRKVITFNRHIDDFSFTVHYGNLSFLSSADRNALGETDLMRVRVKGVRAAFDKHNGTAESKGVKAHFELDESSILKLDRIEFQFEKNETNADNEGIGAKLSKIGNTISSFFSSTSSNENATNETETTTETPNLNSTEIPKNETAEQKNANTTEEVKIEEKIKVINVRENLEFEIEIVDFSDPTEETQKESKKKLNELDVHDRALVALAKAKNNLESFIYEIRDKIENDPVYKNALTEEEAAQINEKFSQADEWLWDEGISADVSTLKSKLDELKKLTRSFLVRVREVDLRPQKIQALKEALNTTEIFIRGAKRIHDRAEENDKPFSIEDLNSLEKIYEETKTWRDNVLAEFKKLLPTDDPKYLSSEFDTQIEFLGRETNYLLTKVQRYVPKQKTTTTTTTPKTETEENKQNSKNDETQTKENQENVKPDENQTEEKTKPDENKNIDENIFESSTAETNSEKPKENPDETKHNEF